MAEVLDVHALAVFGDEATVSQLERTVRKSSDFLGVGHDEEGHTVVLVEVLEQRQHFTARNRVQSTGRLVGQDQARLCDEGAGDGHTLLLTAAQHGWQGTDAMAHAQTGQHGVGQCERLLRGHTLMAKGLCNVVPSVEVGQQVAFLEDERDRLLSQLNQLLACQTGHVLARQTDRPGAGFHQPAEALHEGGFTGP